MNVKFVFVLCTILVVISFLGCKQAIAPKDFSVASSWMQAPKEELLQRWGEPSETSLTIVGTKGDELIYYTKPGVTYASRDGKETFVLTKEDKARDFVFILDKTGKIVNVKVHYNRQHPLKTGTR